MRPTHRLGQLLVLLTLCGTYTASAEDIDLFLRNEAVAGVRPNVLLVLDNAASNNSTITMLDGVTKGAKLDMMRDVLVNILDPDNSSYFRNCLVVGATRTPVGCVTVEEERALRDSINLGLMINNPSGTDAGGYVRYHVRPMNVETNRLNLLAKIRPSIPQSNNAPYAKSMHEAYQYFAGRHDYVGFESSVYDPGAELGDDVYRSPITESCQDNYILFVGNGGPDSGEVRETGTLLSRLGGVLRTDPIQFSPSNYTSSWFDEYARTMKRQDVRTDMDGIQNVTTYTIAVQSPDELPEEYRAEGGARWFEVTRNISADSTWWDDVSTTDVIEIRDDILRKSFRQGVAELEDLLGDDPAEWTWGGIHVSYFRNGSLGESGVAPIEALFNRGPFITNGGKSVGNNTSWNAVEGYEVTNLPSMRTIYDFSDFSNSVAIHTTGQSGHAYHPHYIDMAEMWANVEYLPMLWNLEDIQADAEGHLVLVPK